MTKTKRADSVTVLFPEVAEPAPVATLGKYEPVKGNALKHGILSRLVVLAHESYSEFADMLAVLHRGTPTGRHDRAASRRGTGRDHLAQTAGTAGQGGGDQSGLANRSP